jgi:tetrahydromethanopterin S-methyltransferase subunit G
MATDLEKTNLEAHVDLCEQRYKNLETRLDKIESKVEEHPCEDIQNGNKSMVKVIIGATGTIVAGLLSTIVVLLLKFPG